MAKCKVLTGSAVKGLNNCFLLAYKAVSHSIVPHFYGLHNLSCLTNITRSLEKEDVVAQLWQKPPEPGDFNGVGHFEGKL